MGQRQARPDREKDAAWREMYDGYKEKFPGSKDVAAEELRRWYEACERGEEQLFVVDVRTWAERRLSVLPGSITQSEFEDMYKEGRIPQGSKCVSYCTIGYRSGKFTEELRGRGLDAYNLAGSIVAWTHIDGPLVKPGTTEPTRDVHVFASKWDLASSRYKASYFV